MLSGEPGEDLGGGESRLARWSSPRPCRELRWGEAQLHQPVLAVLEEA